MAFEQPLAIPAELEGALPFAEPWHGQLFALTIKSAQNGCFTWPDWAEKFSTNLATASAKGAPKDASLYYDIWLDTFESILLERGLADAAALSDLKAAWTDAYLHTPHGQPVELDMP